MAENVALGVRRLYKPSKQANRAWDCGEWSKVFEIVPDHLKLPPSIARWPDYGASTSQPFAGPLTAGL